MHDCLFRGRRRNWLASVLLGSTFLMSFSAYRVLHTRHHRFLGDPRDPDDYANYTRHPLWLWCLHFVRLECRVDLPVRLEYCKSGIFTEYRDKSDMRSITHHPLFAG